MKESLEEKVKRLEAENEKLKNEKDKKEEPHRILFPLVIIGLSYYSFELYRKTMIDIKSLIVIILFSGIIAFLIEQLDHHFTDGTKRNIFIVLLKNIFSWGLIVCSVFMILNYYIHFGKVKRSKHELDSIEVNKKEGRLFFNIEYEEKVKKLKFPMKYYRDRRKYKSATLYMTKGLFGFKIIKKQELNY